MKKLITLLVVGVLSGCMNSSNTTELNDLRKENKRLATMVDSLLKTPENRYNKASKLQAQGNDTLAIDEFKQLVEYYPKSNYADLAKKEIVKIESAIKERKDEEERIKRMGFAAIKASTKIKYDYLTLSFSDIQFKENFIFDSYGDRYHYRGAERGSKYLVVRVSITSEVKNPSLPRILAYALKDGELINITPLGLTYEFRRWEDYGSYLGNNADYGNDFAHTSTINFNLGSQIEESKFKGFPIYVVMQKAKAFQRNEGRFNNPPVSYKADDYNYKDVLTTQDLSDTGDYVLIKSI